MQIIKEIRCPLLSAELLISCGLTLLLVFNFPYIPAINFYKINPKENYEDL